MDIAVVSAVTGWLLGLLWWQRVLRFHSVCLEFLLLRICHFAVFLWGACGPASCWLSMVTKLKPLVTILGHPVEEVVDDLLIVVLLTLAAGLSLGCIGTTIFWPLVLLTPIVGWWISRPWQGQISFIGLSGLGVSSNFRLLLQ